MPWSWHLKENEVTPMMLTNRRIQRLSLAALFIAVCSVPLLGATPQPASRTGTAVYYSDKMDGRNVSLKGEKYSKNALTAAAHSRYPLGSMVKVTNLSNNKSVIVKINDRMNPRSRAIIDLSRKAAEEIDMVGRGHAKVSLELVQAK